MKKNLKKLLVAISTLSLVACSQTEQTSQVNQETSSSTQKVTESSSTTKSEKVVNSPDDFPRVDEHTEIDAEAKQAVKDYVGFYSGIVDIPSAETSHASDDNLTVFYKIDFAINEDGSYELYLERDVPGSQIGHLYVTKDNQMNAKLKVGELHQGKFELEYGQLLLSEGPSLTQGFLGEDGELLPMYGFYGSDTPTNYLGVTDNDEIVVKDGKVQATFYLSAYTDKATVIDLEKQTTRPTSLKYSTEQISQYSAEHYKELGMASEVTYQYNTVNEFLQALRLRHTTQKKTLEKIKVVDGSSLTGYYTSDNKEIKNIKFAIFDGLSNSYYVYTGDKVYQLENEHEAKEIKIIPELIDYISYSVG